MIEKRMAKPKSAQIDDMLVCENAEWHPSELGSHALEMRVSI